MLTLLNYVQDKMQLVFKINCSPFIRLNDFITWVYKMHNGQY